MTELGSLSVVRVLCDPPCMCGELLAYGAGNRIPRSRFSPGTDNRGSWAARGLVVKAFSVKLRGFLH